MSKENRASNGIFYRVEGEGEPLLLLHGLMVAGAMFDPLVAILRDWFRMLIPDLRGHGKSDNLDGPYDVAALAADLDTVLTVARFNRLTGHGLFAWRDGSATACAYSAGGGEQTSVWMRLCLQRLDFRERLECELFAALLRIFSPGALSQLILRPSNPKPTGAIGLRGKQAEWMRSIMSANRAPAMRGAVRGLISFDSRAWLKEIAAPTLVVGGSHDHAVPRHHFDMLVNGIPGAAGRLFDRAGHALVWTHTRELADLVRS